MPNKKCQHRSDKSDTCGLSDKAKIMPCQTLFINAFPIRAPAIAAVALQLLN